MNFSNTKKWEIPVNGEMKEVKSVSDGTSVIWTGEWTYTVKLGNYISKVRCVIGSTQTDITTDTTFTIDAGDTLTITALEYSNEPDTYQYAYTMSNFNFNVTVDEDSDGGEVTVYRAATPQTQQYTLVGICNPTTDISFSYSSSFNVLITKAKYNENVYYKCAATTGYAEKSSITSVIESVCTLDIVEHTATFNFGNLSRLQYTLTFGCNTGSWSKETLTVYYGDTVTRDSNVVKVYKWDTGEQRDSSSFSYSDLEEYNSSVSYSSFSSPITKSQTITAAVSFVRKTFNVGFHASKAGSWSKDLLGAEYGDIAVIDGDTVKIYKWNATSTVRGSSTFSVDDVVGYYKNISITGNTGEITSTASFTGTGTYTRIPLTLSFNNGSYGSWSKSSIACEYGDTITKDGLTVSVYKWDSSSTLRGSSVYSLSEDTNQYHYSTSIGSATTPMTANQTISATDTRTTKTYTITLNSTYGYWTNSSGTQVTSVPNIQYGTALSVSNNKLSVGQSAYTFSPNTNTAQYSYAFSSISAVPSTLTGNLTVTGTATRTLQKYYITWTWQDPYNVWVTEKELYTYGDIPSRTLPGAVTYGDYRNRVSGWDNLSAVTGARTIACQYVQQYYATFGGTYCTASRSDGWYDHGTTVYWTASTNCGFSSTGASTSDSVAITLPARYTKSATYYNVTSVSGTHCSAYTNTNYNVAFSTGWKAVGTTIYWKADTGYCINQSNNQQTWTSSVVPGGNSSSASYVCKYTITVNVSGGDYGSWSLTGGDGRSLSNGSAIYHFEKITASASAAGSRYTSWDCTSADLVVPTGSFNGGDATTAGITLYAQNNVTANLYRRVNYGGGYYSDWTHLSDSWGKNSATTSRNDTGLSWSTTYNYHVARNQNRTRYDRSVSSAYSGTNSVTGNITASFSFTEDSGHTESNWIAGSPDTVDIATGSRNAYNVTVYAKNRLGTQIGSTTVSAYWGTTVDSIDYFGSSYDPGTSRYTYSGGSGTSTYVTGSGQSCTTTYSSQSSVSYTIYYQLKYGSNVISSTSKTGYRTESSSYTWNYWYYISGWAYTDISPQTLSVSDISSSTTLTSTATRYSYPYVAVSSNYGSYCYVNVTPYQPVRFWWYTSKNSTKKYVNNSSGGVSTIYVSSLPLTLYVGYQVNGIDSTTLKSIYIQSGKSGS